MGTIVVRLGTCGRVLAAWIYVHIHDPTAIPERMEVQVEKSRELATRSLPKGKACTNLVGNLELLLQTEITSLYILFLTYMIL